jgi:hypothetical protein
VLGDDGDVHGGNVLVLELDVLDDVLLPGVGVVGVVTGWHDGAGAW